MSLPNANKAEKLNQARDRYKILCHEIAFGTPTEETFREQHELADWLSKHKDDDKPPVSVVAKLYS